ncbi:hypothetical protein [Nocardioides rubriscoriae]|uniref:hypothetical protein n=1 Tax=Nocardioides rubriscoriae TaxID=642762 RepID=UPI0011DF5975|nr:hypothetical protein [Nocardioides rubriscoriae]
MIRTLYFDPEADCVREGQIDEVGQVADLVQGVLGRPFRTGHHSAVELIREDGSSLSLATDGRGAAMVWIDPFGTSFHSLGDGSDGEILVYDYMGSWSEAPGDWLVPPTGSSRWSSS